MKKIALFAGILLFSCNMSLFAQGNEIDAYTLSSTELGGTARSMSMAGAFGALGGDISVISGNPAGLGIYRSSEISGTLNLSMNGASTNWMGVGADKSKTSFSPSNFGLSLYFPTSSTSVNSWSLGFSYNSLRNYKRSYRMSSNGQPNSMADYVAWRASNAFGPGNGIAHHELVGNNSHNPYYNREMSGQWLSILGYDSGMIDPAGRNGYKSRFGWDESSGWETESPYHSSLIVNESGHMDEYNIGFGMNISNFLFLGGSVSVTDISYRYTSFYDDFFDDDSDLYLENWLNTEGTAVSLNVGAIMNLQMLRLGVAYNSPRWYDMTDYYNAYAGTYINGYEEPGFDDWTPEDSYSEYRFKTPGKWIFSAAAIVGQSALISADYEISDYRKMRYSDRDGDDRGFIANDFINTDYTWAQTLKIGAEIKVTPQFAVRAGYMIQTSPMRERLVDNKDEVLPSGTIPHFTVTSKPTNYYTVGFGYRFTPNFYTDVACVYRYNDSKVYAFSNTYNRDEEVEVISEPASLKTKNTNLVLTLGYKF